MNDIPTEEAAKAITTDEVALLIKLWFANHPNVTVIKAEFNGEGDSGTLDEAVGACDSGDVDLEEPIKAAVNTLFDKCLDSTGLDWYNNDGGFGNITLNKELKVTLEISIRETRTEDSSYLYDLDGEQLDHDDGGRDPEKL